MKKPLLWLKRQGNNLVKETTAMRQRDLTEIIGKHPSKSYLGRALAMHWNAWGKYERGESEALHPHLRRLVRESRAKSYGINLANSTI